MRVAVFVAGLCALSPTAHAASPPNHSEFYLGLRASAENQEDADGGKAVRLDGIALGLSLLGGDWFLDLELGGLVSRAFGPLLPASPGGSVQGEGPLFFAAAGTHVPVGPGTVATGITVRGRERALPRPFHELAAGVRVAYPWRLSPSVYWAPALDLEALWIPSDAGTSGAQAGLHSVLRFRLSGHWWLRTELAASVARVEALEPVTVLRLELVLAVAWVGASP